MKKRGISHIEMIMAFILFISAVAFIFIFLNPFAVNNPTLAVEKYALNELTALLKTNVTTYALVINSTLEAQITDKVIQIDLGSPIPKDAQVHAENYSGSILPSGISLDRNYIYLKWNKENGRVILLSLSEEFDAFAPIPSSPLAQNENYYQISSSVFSEPISEKRASNILTDYSNYYSVLKEDLTIPSQADFAFKLSLPGRVYAADKTIPENTEVSSRNKIVSVVSSDGNRALGNLEVSVW